MSIRKALYWCVDPKRQTVLVLGIALVALMVRVVYVLTLGSQVHWNDETEYHGLAVSLMKGMGFAFLRGPYKEMALTAYRMPALPALLSVVYRVFGADLLVARLFQAVLGAALIPVVYLIARHLGFALRTALLAACLAALYPYHIFCAGAVYPVILPALTSSLALLMLLKATRRTDGRYEAAAGVFLGLTLLAFGHILAGIPLIIVWLMVNKQGSVRARLSACSLLVATTALVSLPWVVRNQVVMGRPMLSTAFAYNLYVGNLPQAKWDSGSRVMDMEPADVTARRLPMNETEGDAYYTSLAKDQLLASPGRILLLSVGRAVNFWRPYPNTVNRQVRPVEKLIGLLSYGPVVLLAAVWFFFLSRDRRRDGLLVLGPVGAMLLAAVSVSIDRYRLPFDANLIILASAAVLGRERRRAARLETFSTECKHPAETCDLTIAIVSWNVRDLLDECLCSICRNASGVSQEVIVVDNASSDGTAQMVAEKYPHVRLIANTENAGFAAANNQAIGISTGRHFMLLNPDTVVLSDLMPLIGFLDGHPDVGVASCKCLNADDSIQMNWNDYYPSVLWDFMPEFLRHPIWHRLNGRDANSVFQTAWVGGQCMTVRKECIEQVGLMDESFFMYTEETDWCYRISQSGWKIVHYPGIIVRHLGGQSTGQVRAKMLAQLHRSKVQFIRKHRSKSHARIYKCLLYIKTLSVWGMLSVCGRRFGAGRSAAGQILRSVPWF